MEIQVREKCKECNGQGLIDNPVWDGFWIDEEKHKKETGNAFTNEECLNWFRDVYGYSSLPPEEMQCPECEGTGKVHKYIDLKELKTLIENL